METKDDLILSALQHLLRVAAQYARIEEMPIPVREGVSVTTREAHTIQAVGDRGGMSVTDVATAFGITKSAASQMVSRLSDKGFLDKNQAPHSNKEYQITLTPLGREAYAAHERFHGADREELLQRLRGFSLSQIATISVLLEAVGEVMERRLAQ